MNLTAHHAGGALFSLAEHAHRNSGASPGTAKHLPRTLVPVLIRAWWRDMCVGLWLGKELATNRGNRGSMGDRLIAVIRVSRPPEPPPKIKSC